MPRSKRSAKTRALANVPKLLQELSTDLALADEVNVDACMSLVN